MRPVLCVVGARPNFIKMAPILRALAAQQPPVPTILVHTGQHYDASMSERMFIALGLPEPDVNLEVGAAFGGHALQTAEVMRRFDPLLDQYQPSCVLVVGDVNSTLACALVARKRGVPLVHVEAGLRSFDRSMPEEINRVLTDQLADRHYTTEQSAADNLVAEGIAPTRVVFAGNVMIDSLAEGLVRASAPRDTLRRFAADATLLEAPMGWGVVTLHRAANVDQAAVLRALVRVLVEVSQRIPLVFPMHPRTRSQLVAHSLCDLLRGARIAVLPPQDYLEMLGLVRRARLVLTDSGGLQEECTALGVPCLTLRQNTERPVTVEQGTNTLVGQDRRAILRGVDAILSGHGKRGRVPDRWDGHAAERIAADLRQWLQAGATR